MGAKLLTTFQSSKRTQDCAHSLSVSQTVLTATNSRHRSFETSKKKAIDHSPREILAPRGGHEDYCPK